MIFNSLTGYSNAVVDLMCCAVEIAALIKDWKSIGKDVTVMQDDLIKLVFFTDNLMSFDWSSLDVGQCIADGTAWTVDKVCYNDMTTLKTGHNGDVCDIDQYTGTICCTTGSSCAISPGSVTGWDLRGKVLTLNSDSTFTFTGGASGTYTLSNGILTIFQTSPTTETVAWEVSFNSDYSEMYSSRCVYTNASEGGDLFKYTLSNNDSSFSCDSATPCITQEKIEKIYTKAKEIAQKYCVDCK